MVGWSWWLELVAGVYVSLLYSTIYHRLLYHNAPFKSDSRYIHVGAESQTAQHESL